MFILVLTVVLAVLTPQIWSAPAEDEIKNLPGLSDKIYFKQYSGYLNASEGKFLHYWFVTSERSPQKDPLLLWLNGGPGCSSLFGHLGENGPIHVNPDGKTLFINPFRWNKIANILYLEAPAGVGFSYDTTGNYTINDDQVANDNYLALKSFFAKFPEFRKNDFYVTGESYGGVYVPTLSLRILTGTQPINLKGFAVGNGISDWDMNGNSLIFFGYYHGLFGERLWDDLVKYCCNGVPTRDNCKFSNAPNQKCQDAVSAAQELVQPADINMYNLYSDCATDSGNGNKKPTKNTREAFDSRIIPFSLGLKRKLTVPSEVIPCVDDSRVSNWLNQGSVRKALHIPDSVQAWEECSTVVAQHYITIYQTLKPVYEKLMASGKVRALVYNGDVDMACNFLGDQWFVESLGLPQLTKYQEWHYKQQNAGYYKKFQSLTLVTIRGSGHMVPQDKPGQAYKMISEFLKGSI